MTEVIVALMADCEIDNIIKLSAEQANCSVHKLHPVKKTVFSIQSVLYKLSLLSLF